MFRRIGAHCHSGDVDLAKSLARNIMYYEYKIDYNSPIPIVHEAEVISKETRKKHGSHEKAKAFEDLLRMLYVSEAFYMESNKDVVIKPFPISYNHLIPDEASKELVLVEMANIKPDKNGCIKKLDEEFKALTTYHIAVIKAGDEWDIWIGKDVSKDIASSAKSVIVNMVSADDDDLHESQMYGRNVRLTRQGKESILFKALFTDDCFPPLEPPVINSYIKSEDSCKIWTHQLLNYITCSVISSNTTSAASNDKNVSNAPTSSSSQHQMRTEMQSKQLGESCTLEETAPVDVKKDIFNLEDTLAAPDVHNSNSFNGSTVFADPAREHTIDDGPFIAPTTINSKFWMKRQKSRMEIMKAKDEEVIDEEEKREENRNSYTNRLGGVYLEEIEIEGNKVSLDSEVLGQLTEEKKEEVAMQIDPFRYTPQLNVRTAHARHIVTTAAFDPNSLIGWQIEMGHKGLRVVMNAARAYTCGGFSFGGCKFEVLEGNSSDPEWVRLKLKPTSKGYAVKILRKTTLCKGEDDNGQNADDGEEE